MHSWDDIVFGKVDPDCGIKIGDLITAYHKGWWVVEDIERRFHEKPKPPLHDYCPSWPDGAPYPSFIYYRQVAKADGTPTPKSKKSNACCATYCKIWTPSDLQQQYNQEKNEALTRFYNLTDIYNDLQQRNP